MNISVIICTKDRPFDLGRVLDSLLIQTYQLKELIIVDGSDNSVKEVVERYIGKLPIQYFHLRPPGLTRQRNFGISKLSTDSDWVGFLDDDLELEKDCLSNLERYILETPSLKGVGLRINDQRNLGRSRLREFMLLDSYPGGVVTKSGAAAPIRPYKESIKTKWLYGGATFWHISVLKEFKFDEWFSGVGYCEDLDYSYRVSQKYDLAVCAEAKCFHHHKQPSLEKMSPMGEWLVVAWWYFARIKNQFNPFMVLWGIGWMSLNNLIISAAKKDERRFRMFKGNLAGLRKIFSGHAVKAQGFQK